MADLTAKSTVSAALREQVSRSLRRRLEPALVRRIVTEYEADATTPSLCDTYGLSKTGILRLLRDEGVTVRRRPLTVDQIEVARKLHEHGHPIAAIATHLDTSYNNVRQRLIEEGVQLRPRGGSYRRLGSFPMPPSPLRFEHARTTRLSACRGQTSAAPDASPPGCFNPP